MTYYSPVIERMPRQELKAIQWRLLKYQLDHLYHKNPFYKRLWDQHKVHPDDIQTPEDFRNRIPMVRKKDFVEDQREHSPYGDRLGVAPCVLENIYLTSGTSGLGQELYGVNPADAAYGGHGWAFGYYWSGLRRGLNAYNFFPLSISNLAGPDSATRGFIEIGANVFQVGHLSAQDKINQFMTRFQPHFILTVPAYLQRMTAVCQEMLGCDPKQAFPDLVAIMICTEPYTVTWARRMSEVWGCPLYELYGSTQMGTCASANCEKGVLNGDRRGTIHMLEHFCYTEILDRETRQPVEPGQPGELIVTNLLRTASPVIRLATDDRVTYVPHTACTCGRAFDGIEAGTISRFDDMIKIKMVNVWPSAIDAILFDTDEVAEYAGRVYTSDDSQEKVSITIEFYDRVAPERRKQVMQEFSGSLRTRIGVAMELVEAQEKLPRFDFKMRRWTDERLQGRERILWTKQ